MFRTILQLWTDALAKAATERKLEMSEAISTTSLAALALEIAVGELGKGETGRNNQGPHVAKYRGDRKAGAWCASFVGWCWEKAARQRMIEMPFKRSNGAKRIYKNAGKAGTFVDRPQPGDLVCWQRGNGRPEDAWKGHVGLVFEVDDDGKTFKSIEGNVGKFPAKVGIFSHHVGEKRLIGFARV